MARPLFNRYACGSSSWSARVRRRVAEAGGEGEGKERGGKGELTFERKSVVRRRPRLRGASKVSFGVL